LEGFKARDGRLATIIGVFIFRNDDQGCSTGTFDRQGRGEAFLPLESRDKKFDREAAVPAVRKEVGDPRIRPARAPRRSSAERNVQGGGVVRILTADKTDYEISVGPVHWSAMLVGAERASDLAARPTGKHWRASRQWHAKPTVAVIRGFPERPLTTELLLVRSSTGVLSDSVIPPAISHQVT